jgi:hypothetical protein
MKKLMLIILACPFLLSGCYGIGMAVFGPETEVSDQKSINKEDFIRIYGIPNKINKLSETDEVLIYNDGLGWSGIMPYISFFIPIPIPLAIPTHSKWREYYVSNSVVQKKKIRFTSESNCFAGYGIEDESGSPYHWMGRCK